MCPYDWLAAGGVQSHVRGLSAELRRRGHEVLVLTPASRRPGQPWVHAVGTPMAVPFNGSVAPVCPDPRSRGRIRVDLEWFAPDVIHVHEPFAPSTSLYAAQMARHPLVATFHAYAGRSRALATFAPLLRKLWQRIDVRVAVSAAAAGFVSRHFSGDIRVIPNGVEVERFAGASPAHLPSGRGLLFVGRLEEPRKGFDVAVRAFELLGQDRPDLSLVAVGSGHEPEAVRGLPAELRRRVVLAGYRPDEELPGYHAAAGVFVAPGLGGESFGVVLVEAMAAGLPVVASDIPGYREVVRHDVEGLLVRPSDPAALAGAVRRVLGEPGLGPRLGAAGRARAQRFSWATVTGEIEAAYQEAIEVHRS